jgi:sodium-dependent phosphate cotransporter
LFNLIGVLLFFPATPLRNLPLWFARRLGKATLRNRLYGFAYIILTFFVIPFFLIFFSQKIVNKQGKLVKTPVNVIRKAEGKTIGDTMSKKK